MRLRGGGEAPEKAIVFSQWTGMLDLVEAAVGRARHRFRRLDGSMSITAREAAIANFQARPHVVLPARSVIICSRLYDRHCACQASDANVLLRILLILTQAFVVSQLRSKASERAVSDPYGHTACTQHGFRHHGRTRTVTACWHTQSSRVCG